MKSCEIDYDGGPPSNKTGYVWCETHKLPADHNAGRDAGPVCAVSARLSGCMCCKENYDKLDMSPRDAFHAFILGEIVKNGDDVAKAAATELLNELKNTSSTRYF